MKKIETSFILTGKVLLDNTHTMFKSVCATPTVHQNAIFWPKSWFCGPKKEFLPILTPKSALCPKFLLPHGISGYLLRRIWWRLFLSRKKSPEDFINCYVCPKFRFWSHFGHLDLFFTKIAPKYPHMMMIGHVVGPHCTVGDDGSVLEKWKLQLKKTRV